MRSGLQARRGRPRPPCRRAPSCCRRGATDAGRTDVASASDPVLLVEPVEGFAALVGSATSAITTPPDRDACIGVTSFMPASDSLSLSDVASSRTRASTRDATDGGVEVERRPHCGEAGVVALPQGLELPCASRVRIGVVAPSRCDDVRPDPGDVGLLDVEDARFLRTHRPLVAAPRVAVAAHVTEVDVEGTPALGAVDVDVDATCRGLPPRSPSLGGEYR